MEKKIKLPVKDLAIVGMSITATAKVMNQWSEMIEMEDGVEAIKRQLPLMEETLIGMAEHIAKLLGHDIEEEKKKLQEALELFGCKEEEDE